MTTQTETTQSHHHRAVRLFWCLLIGATLVSLIGNVVHAILPYIPRTVIQIGAAAHQGKTRTRGWSGVTVAAHAEILIGFGGLRRGRQ